jgi:DNA helicase-2/ATP-dependent DNA helicase PcrA
MTVSERSTVAVAPTARERVETWVENTANVSEQQREAVRAPGDMFLSACPGSGKTRTVGVRLAWWSVHPEPIAGILRPRRIAALSYTNVAVQEIGLAAEAAGSAVGEPDFLGTIHGFVLRYIVRPFGVAVMGCTAPPRLVVETRGRTKIDGEMVPFTERVGRRRIPRTISVWDLHFRADGSLVVGADAELYGCDMAHTAIAAAVQRAGRRVKHQLAADGLMSMSDALYWSMKILEVSEHAEAVAARFDELIVDESQDTTDTQLRCLALLKAAGLRSLVCIGDPAQSIYGFAGAVPEALDRLVEDLKLRRCYLKENWRSSRRICETAVHFSDRQHADDAVSER